MTAIRTSLSPHTAPVGAMMAIAPKFRLWRLLATFLLPAISGPAFAANFEGFYFGADLGISLASDLESTRINTGVSTNCDQWLGSAVLNDGTAVPLPAEQCQPRPLPASPSDFTLDAGLLAGLNAGYEMGQFRLEAEYYHRRQSGEELALVVPGDPKQAEFTERSETIGDLRSNNLFANLYYDFQDTGMRGVVGYLGIGLGAMDVEIDYRARSRRNSDPAALLALGRNPNAAGTESRADEKLSDNLWGYQLLGGLDYPLGPGQALTIKLRYGHALDDFKDGGNAWKPLRGHDSTVGPDGAPVHYEIRAEDLNFWTLSVGLKFR